MSSHLADMQQRLVAGQGELATTRRELTALRTAARPLLSLVESFHGVVPSDEEFSRLRSRVWPALVELRRVDLGGEAA